MSPQRRLAASIALLVLIGGAVVGLAVARTHLGHHPKRPSLALVKAPGTRVAISGMAPGDHAERLVVLQNRGKRPLRRVRLIIRARGRKPSPLVSGPARLLVRVDRCPGRLRRLSGRTPRYRCSKRFVPVVRSSRLPLSRMLRMPAIRPGRRASLRTTFTLPANGGNALEGLSVVLTARFVVAGGR